MFTVLCWSTNLCSNTVHRFDIYLWSFDTYVHLKAWFFRIALLMQLMFKWPDILPIPSPSIFVSWSTWRGNRCHTASYNILYPDSKSLHSPRQQVIIEAIIKDMIIGCCLSLVLQSNGFQSTQILLFLTVRVLQADSEERIASAFDEITEGMVSSNMKCAFKVNLPQQQSDDSESEEETLDDEHLWEDMNSVEGTELPRSWGEHLSCSAHSLQLFVNDCMKEIWAISRTIVKT